MKKLKLAILRNEVSDDHVLWEKSCEEMKDVVDWEVIDITRSGWLEQTLKGSFDGLLAHPGAYTTPFRTLYDERVTILNAVCNIPVFPTLEEIHIYENKKYLSYWLAANNIPHPETHVFYQQDEALDFLKTTSFPLVAKTNLGAGGKGVIFLNTFPEGENYINETFSGKGINNKTGPAWRKKGFIKRGFKKLLHPGELKLQISKYRLIRSETQKDFVLFQEYIPHTFEWRCVRIGDSFFAHKKLKLNGKASGSLLKNYDTPPTDLLDFVKDLTDRKKFQSQAIDVFVSEEGSYLVNEMQCIFGQSDPYQMLVNGEPGRYIFHEGTWVFEPGDFNKFECFLLRLQTFINILTKKQTTALHS